MGFTTGILAFVLAGAVSAQHRITGSGDVQAKISYCKDCHGVSAQGFNGYYPIPRLAGQQPEYIENQLRAFTEHRRTNNIMFNVAHSLESGHDKRSDGAFCFRLIRRRLVARRGSS